MNTLKRISIISLALLVSGCKMVILDPKGMIAATEKHILLGAVGLMLIVVIPVIILNFLFAWKYRANNTKTKYTPTWAHNNMLEAIWWAIPCVIILALATIAWISTHRLDPYRPLAVKGEPLEIQAVALDWKWLFIYPKQNIATVNYIQIPVNKPIRFFITADAPMNSFQIPQLAGQIYAMTGMQTKINIIANHKGNYRGLSTNFSGNGFSGMHFVVHAGSNQEFNRWVQKAKRSPKRLTITQYKKLAKSSSNNAVEYFSSSTDGLFQKIIAQYMKPNAKLFTNNAARVRS